MADEQAQDDGCEIAHGGRHIGGRGLGTSEDRAQVRAQRMRTPAEPAQQRLAGGVLEGTGAQRAQCRVQAAATAQQAIEEASQNGRAMLGPRDAERRQQATPSAPVTGHSSRWIAIRSISCWSGSIAERRYWPCRRSRWPFRQNGQRTASRVSSEPGSHGHTH